MAVPDRIKLDWRELRFVPIHTSGLGLMHVPCLPGTALSHTLLLLLSCCSLTLQRKGQEEIRGAIPLRQSQRAPWSPAGQCLWFFHGWELSDLRDTSYRCFSSHQVGCFSCRKHFPLSWFSKGSLIFRDSPWTSYKGPGQPFLLWWPMWSLLYGWGE